MRVIPLLPAARLRLECGMAGIDALLINIQNSRGISIFKGGDDDGDFLLPF